MLRRAVTPTLTRTRRCAGLGASGIETNSLLTAADMQGYNVSLYMLTDDVGFAEVLQRCTGFLPAGTLRLNVAITAVQRPAADAAPGSPVFVTYTQTGNPRPHTVQCGALINTVAQALPNLGFLQLDSTELALFRQVIWCRYFTIAMLVQPKLPQGTYALPFPLDDGTYRRMRFARLRGDHTVDSFEHKPTLPLLSALVDPYPYRGA